MKYIYINHYKLFCNNINPSLKKELNINDDIVYQDSLDNLINIWIPPTTYGLNNSERIIPIHYFDDNNDSLNINMFYELTKDVRNLIPLNEIQLNYVKTLPRQKIIELLELYNFCLKNINKIIDKLE